MAGRRGRGEGSIYQRKDGRWVAELDLGYVNGRRLRRPIYGRTREDAAKKLRDAQNAQDEGRLPVGKTTTVEQWVRYYLDVIAPRRLRGHTLVNYRRKAKLYIYPNLGRHRLDQLVEEHVEALYALLEARGLKPSTIRQAHFVLSGALAEGVRRKKVARNVCEHAAKPGLGGRRGGGDALEQDEARAVLTAARGRRNAARWTVALSIGMRQGESLGLSWPYVDLEQGTVDVQWELVRLPWQHGCPDPKACAGPHHRTEPCPADCRRHTRRDAAGRPACPPPCAKDCAGHALRCPDRRGGGLLLEPPKSKSSCRLITLPERLVDELRAQRQAQLEERVAAGPLWVGSGLTYPDTGEPVDLVFTQPNGRPVDSRRDWDAWKDLLAAAGVRGVRVHDARHTAATLLLELGVDERVVMEILGHASIQLTRNTYQQVTVRLERDAAARMGQALWGEADSQSDSQRTGQTRTRRDSRRGRSAR